MITATSLREEIASNKYIGYELHAAKQLMRRIPRDNAWGMEDVLSHMRLYALEAADSYDPTKRAAFPSWLYKHLQQRSYQWFNWSRLQQTRPKNGILSFTQLVVEEGDSFDPEDRPATLRAVTVAILEQLTPEARAVFDRLLAREASRLLARGETLEVAGAAVGVPKSEVVLLVREVRICAGNCTL